MICNSEEGRHQVESRSRQILSRWPVDNPQPARFGDTFVIASGPPDGPARVLLHRSASNSFVWMGDIACWEHVRVYAIDIIGKVGLVGAAKAPDRLGKLRAVARRCPDGLCVSHLALVGLSLGGRFALDYASKNPIRIDALCVLCLGGMGCLKYMSLRALRLSVLGSWG